MSERVPDAVGELASGVRFGKFLSVGAVGAVVDTTVLVVLTTYVGLSAAVANVASIETAILLMFAINERWTFARDGAPGVRAVGRRLLRSHLVRAGGSTIQFLVFVGVFYGYHREVLLGEVNLWLVVVKAGAIGIAVLVNYVFESLFTWRVHEGH